MLELVEEEQGLKDVSFYNIPMWVIQFIQPEAVFFIERYYKELSICFLLYYHRVETFHLIDKPVLCFGTDRNHVNELAFGFHKRSVVCRHYRTKKGSLETPL
jgi:hypothetical protein